MILHHFGNQEELFSRGAEAAQLDVRESERQLDFERMDLRDALE
ncbi:MAG: hypothetical protein OXN84_19775 [Albidovulum sp.]|nr:hypothetical protein [Albidovulum sp.]